MNFESGTPLFRIDTIGVDPNLIVESPICPHCQKEFKTLSSTKKHISNKVCLNDEHGQIVYVDETFIEGKSFNSINLKENEIARIIPQTNIERSTFYSFARSGSGKSTSILHICEEYYKVNKKTKFYIFSALEEDKTFDDSKIKFKRIKLDATFLKTEIPFSEFQNSVSIFDDIDCLPNRKGGIKEKVMKILNALLQLGRHARSSVFIANHCSTQGIDTKIILNESMWFILFPSRSSPKQLAYLLESYVGLDNKAIKKLVNIPTRSVKIWRGYPSVAIGEKCAYVLKNGED